MLSGSARTMSGPARPMRKWRNKRNKRKSSANAVLRREKTVYNLKPVKLASGKQTVIASA